MHPLLLCLFPLETVSISSCSLTTLQLRVDVLIFISRGAPGVGFSVPLLIRCFCAVPLGPSFQKAEEHKPWASSAASSLLLREGPVGLPPLRHGHLLRALHQFTAVSSQPAQVWLPLRNVLPRHYILRFQNSYLVLLTFYS